MFGFMEHLPGRGDALFLKFFETDKYSYIAGQIKKKILCKYLIYIHKGLEN